MKLLAVEVAQLVTKFYSFDSKNNARFQNVLTCNFVYTFVGLLVLH